MTNREAIEFLKNMIDRESIGFVCPKGDGDVAIWQYHVESLQMAIAALEKQAGKKPIGIKAESQDPYTEVADIVDDWCRKNYYGSAFVTLSLDGRVTTEYLSFNGNDMEFEWAMDWWEGERNVVLLGFRMRADVAFYGYPNSEME